MSVFKKLYSALLEKREGDSRKRRRRRRRRKKATDARYHVTLAFEPAQQPPTDLQGAHRDRVKSHVKSTESSSGPGSDKKALVKYSLVVDSLDRYY